MTEHSNLIGGSSAERRINCPASYKLELPYPNTSSEYAEEGTACHEAMEYILLNECPATDVIGMFFNKNDPKKPEGHEITDGDEGLFMNKIMPAYESWLEILEKYGELDYIVEARCDLSSVIDGAFGTVDVLASVVGDPSTKIVLDWKFGSGVSVSPYANYQCGFYAAAALNTQGDDDIKEIMQDAEKLVFIIVQPDNGEPQYQEWETTTKWTAMLTDLTIAAVEQAQSDDAPIKPGKHCRWCKHKAGCEAQQDTVLTALENDPSTMTPIERAYWLNKTEQLKGWLSALLGAAHEEIERGVAIPGWKNVDKRATRKWSGDDEEIGRIVAGVLGEKAAFHDPKVLSPAQAEKELRKQFTARKEKRGVWAKTFEAELEPHIVKQSSGTTLAKDEDARPAVVDSMNLLAKALEKAKPGKQGAH